MRLAIECRVYLRLFGMLNNSICRHITLYTTLLLWDRENDPSFGIMTMKMNTPKKKKKNSYKTVQSVHTVSTSSPSLKPNQHNYKLQFFFSSFNKIEKRFGWSESSDDTQQDEIVRSNLYVCG